jgi:pyruvate formate-lyase activating enzyme-like uncharacterized protein
MAKDLKLEKNGNEITINELNLDNYLSLGYKLVDNNKPKPKKENKKWQHITEKKES